MGDRLLIIGNPEIIHIGAHLFRGAKEIGLPARLCDMRAAYDAPWPVRKFNWCVRGRRPAHLISFSCHVVEECRTYKPRWLLTTGLAPIESRALEEIGRLGVTRLNYLTDDPWNRAHKSSWLFQALPHYDHVFSPRRANIEDLLRLGCPKVSYLSFAYDPELHFPEPPTTPEEQARFECDIVFSGGADEDRVPFVLALIKAGFKVALYGGYWDRHRELLPFARGHADPKTLRKAVAGAKIALCLVRRANRDGHAMRTFELPAMKACMMAEDTHEHREIFGEDGETVVYFKTIPEMIEKARWLLEHPEERKRMKEAAHILITGGMHTYKERLVDMLGIMIQ